MKYSTLNLTRLRKHQRGVGLIEILIAVVIMAMGFLAAARMQVEGMRFSQSAYYQSQAHFLASDMIERMRGNIAGVIADNYTNMTTIGTAPAQNCDICTPVEIAQLDQFEWSSSLFPLTAAAGFIPALAAPASGTITRVGAIGQRFMITMNWNELVQGANQQQTLTIQFELETAE